MLLARHAHQIDVILRHAGSNMPSRVYVEASSFTEGCCIRWLRFVPRFLINQLGFVPGVLHVCVYVSLRGSEVCQNEVIGIIHNIVILGAQ